MLLGVVNNVLDLSKIEAGEMLLENLPFSLPELAGDLGQMLAPQAAAKGVDLNVHIASDLPRTLLGDASRLRQILTNLLHNSIKFTDAGRVTLEVSLAHSAPDHIRLRCVVTDTGIGIEPTLLSRLFLPFTQADASTPRRFGGTGLGLSIARRFVELMGGEIGVTSSVAAGSTFWVELPFQRAASLDDTRPVRRAGRRHLLVADSQAAAPDSLSVALNEQHSQWLLGVHVLAVDDSDLSLDVVRHILESQGALVATCSDGTRALEYVRRHQQQLDVVLMDVQMPLLDGNEVTRRIREDLELRCLPVVALTAGVLVGERQRCLEAGMNDFISKPFDPPALIRKLRRLVQQVRGAALPGARPDALSLDNPGSSRWPALPSLDMELLRKMYGDEVDLVLSLLARVLHEYVDLEQSFVVPVDDLGERDKLRCRIHKLKGSAGLLGATQLMQRAGAVETALRDGRETQILERALSLMRSALRALREEARPLMEQPAAQPGDIGAQTPSSDLLDQDIAQLCDLLDQQDLQAVDRFHGLAQSWHELPQMAEFQCVREAIETLQFTTASAQLRLVWLRRGASSPDAVAK